MIIEDEAIVYKRGGDNEIRHPEEYKISLDLGHKNIAIGMSGGMDSAMLLWLLAHHINENQLDCTIHQWTCSLDERPFQYVHAKKVVQFVKDCFPDVKFGEHRHMPTRARDYIKNGTLLSWRLCADHEITATFNGVTKNPSEAEGKYWGETWPKRAPTRDIDTDWTKQAAEEVKGWPDQDNKQTHWEYLPFIHTDKRVVLAFYKKYSLLLDLGPLTRSCEGGIELTNDFTTECHKCWWCIEKRWAISKIWNRDPKKELEDYPGIYES